MPAGILVVGTISSDNVSTPRSAAEAALGGSGSYAALSAAFHAHESGIDIAIASRVGGDEAGASALRVIKGAGIDTNGIERFDGSTFRWQVRYEGSMEMAMTEVTNYGVLDGFRPTIEGRWKDARILFCANCDPEAQASALDRVHDPEIIALDSMACWIESHPEALSRCLRRIDVLFLNEHEARLLAGEGDVVRSIEAIRSGAALVGGASAGSGPPIVVIKRGDLGAIATSPQGVVALPGHPTPHTLDPTGCGDAFGGAFLGRLAQRRPASVGIEEIRDAMMHAIVMSSFVVESHGADCLTRLDRGAYRARLDLQRRIIGL